MLASHTGSKMGWGCWTLLQRAARFGFIALVAIVSYFTLLPIKGLAQELVPRIILHMALAFSLVSLLVAKAIPVRGQKVWHVLLCALGITIYAIACTLVAFNIAVHFLRAVSIDKAPFWISATLLCAVLLCAGFAFANKAKPSERHSQPRASSSAKPARTSNAVPGESLTLTLALVKPQNHDAKVLRFLLPRGKRLEARPGQFLTFEWFIEGKHVYRSYSICSSPTQTGYIEIMPKRTHTGYVSQFLNDHASPGLMVKARGPYGQFYFDENKHDRIVLIASGSGITPMISILRYIRELRIAVNCTLIYCVRSASDLIFNGELSVLAEQMNSFRYVAVFSQGSSEWTGWKGRLRWEILESEIEKPLESTYFLCGPPGFMEVGRGLLEEMSVEPSRILQESFGGQVETDEGFASKPSSVNVKLAR